MKMKMRVAGLLFEEQKILTTKMRKNGKDYHVLPGGGVEEKESIRSALKREFLEETCLKIEEFDLAYIRELDIRNNGRGIEFYYIIKDYSGEVDTGYDPEEKNSELKDVSFKNPENLQELRFHPEELISHIEKKGIGNNEVKHLGFKRYPEK